MARTAQDVARSRSRNLPVALTALAAIAATKAALWFYFRARQPLTDRRTSDRLQPKARAS